jgi:hypothetical protein
MAALFAGLAALPAAPAFASSAWTTVAGRPAIPSGARALGAVPSGQVIVGDVGLAPRDPAALAAFAGAVTNPRSPMYRHYVPAREFARAFGPAPRTIAAVERHLLASGAQVTGVSGNGLLISFRATAAQVQAAFATHLESYRLANGRVAFAPSAGIALPAGIAPAVQAVVGLSTLHRPEANPLRGGPGHPKAQVPAKIPAPAAGPVACAAAKKDAAVNGGLTDQQIADSYGVDGLYGNGNAGAGQTIAVYELEPFSRTDLKTFDACYFGAARAASMISRVHIVPVDGGQQNGSGSGESILDLDDVSALAPGANLQVYEAPLDLNPWAALVDNFNAIVQDDTAKIATSSWSSGLCEADVQSVVPGLDRLENTIFEQAAVQGQTILESSGDSGSDTCPNTSPQGTPVPLLSQSPEAAQPYVLSVGGTTITQAGNPPTEQVWNDGIFEGAGGGGISSIWPAPSWQANSRVPGVLNASTVKAAESVTGTSFCGSGSCREVPDVSAQADEFTGAVTVYDSSFGGWITIGGTSSSAPLWAAMLADINSTPACQAAGGLGFVPPRLYAIASDPSAYQASFNDVTAGNNDMFADAFGLFPATAGYDMATGLGSPKVTAAGGRPGLAVYLCAASSATVTVSAVAPAAVPAAGGTVRITGAGFEAGGHAYVAGVQVGTVNLPQSAFTVQSPTSLRVHLPSAKTQLGAGAAGDGAGTYAVTVTLDSGQSSAPRAAARITYYPTSTGGAAKPQVDGVNLPGGNDAGGMQVEIYGAGFSGGTGTPTVTFGGVAASGVTVIDDNHLTAVVPPYRLQTACATKADPATDVCQTEVQVTTGQGSSALSKIRPEFSGPAANLGLPGTGEFLPAATEFDYFPTPTITSISVDTGLAGPFSLATITGKGLGELGFEWVNVGPYQDATSADPFIGSISGTQLTVFLLPPLTASTSRMTLPVTVETAASLNHNDLTGSPPSNSGTVTFAATPEVSSIQVLGPDGKPAAFPAGPTTGGTKIVINGAGLEDANQVGFADTVGPAGSTYTFSFSQVSPSQISLLTPQDNPSIDQVFACSISGCSTPRPKNDTFTYYPVGNPQVTAVNPATGAAGTNVTIDGQNLGFIKAVYFGKVKATTFANAPGPLDSGSTTEVTATAPPGTAGATVAIRVITLESAATGFGKSPVNPAATFRYSQ